VESAKIWSRQQHGSARRPNKETGKLCESYGTMLMEGRGVARNCNEALFWLRKVSFSLSARKRIAEIEKEAGALEKKGRKSQSTFRDVVARVRAGDSVFGTTMPLHTAAMSLTLDTVALLYEHPSFDLLVMQSQRCSPARLRGRWQWRQCACVCVYAELSALDPCGVSAVVRGKGSVGSHG
jgi:hypothetical protein